MPGAGHVKQFLEVDDVVEQVGRRFKAFVSDGQLEEGLTELGGSPLLRGLEESVVVLLDVGVAAFSCLLIFSLYFVQIELHGF